MVTASTTITVLGTGSAIPDTGGDTASLVINNRYLVDTGWFLLHNLRTHGIDPLQIDSLFFTHFHHDHYLALPQLLFYWAMRRRPLHELRILGPAADLELVVARSMSFLQLDRFFPDAGHPTLVPLLPGASFENADLSVTTCGSRHPVDGLCYRILDRQSGREIGISGDTAFHLPIADHVRGCAVLVHECALGPEAGDVEANPSLHSGAEDAARIAAAAGVGQLMLLHHARSSGAACVEAARRIFPPTMDWVADGQTIVLGNEGV